ncbi:putative porin [Tamlana agarivorans]|uniref:Porin n=1 Tax=Pseudotamlana agarivorans TaxID=481183 RepID=A0ACC5UCJ0_9FLAO|nr:putative porin [Tamlana agarivorans]MBU2951923.1 putative porin [Tamlana agarivorans]
MRVTLKRNINKRKPVLSTIILVFVFLLFSNLIGAQANPERRLAGTSQDSIREPEPDRNTEGSKKVKLKGDIEEYQIISHLNDTTYLDTTLTIQKDYKFNYLRKDNFGLIPFSNLGQTYNSLTYNFENTKLMPRFGARARHFNFMEVEDINYYRVPTPLTELSYRSAFEQGQLVDAFFTANMSPRLNFSIAYKGLRSLGKYQHLLTSTGNFRFTMSYATKNDRYHVRGHWVTQDLMNQENGGLDEDSVLNFESGNPEFSDRSILEVGFENAENILVGKRYHLDHHYKIIKPNDSLAKNKLNINHIITAESKYYQYDQTTANTTYFGSSFNSNNLYDKTTLKTLYNELQLNYSNNIIGDLQFNVNDTYYNYGYDQLVLVNGETITNRLKGDVVAVGGKYHKQYKGFELVGDIGANILGDFDGNYIKAEASFKLNKDIEAIASINHSSKAPNFNTLLYQSNYLDYNWQNDFNNQETQQLAFKLKSDKWANISVDFSTIDNYVYFKEDQISGQVSPFQNDETLTYLRVRLEKEFRLGKFALNNTIEYQSVDDANQVLNVPEFNTRNTLYFSSHMFKKALFLQTGLTVNYFTKYYMNAYNPVLAEFYVQNDRTYGNFPRFDYFINAKIRQARLFLKAEHFNSSFTGNNFYSAPNNPYRDFTVRFGVVWALFL